MTRFSSQHSFNTGHRDPHSERRWVHRPFLCACANCSPAPGPSLASRPSWETIPGLQLRALRERRVSPRWLQGRRVLGARGHPRRCRRRAGACLGEVLGCVRSRAGGVRVVPHLCRANLGPLCACAPCALGGEKCGVVGSVELTHAWRGRDAVTRAFAGCCGQMLGCGGWRAHKPGPW